MTDPLFREITDPAERSRKLVENGRVAAKDLREYALAHLGDHGTHVFNQVTYLLSVIKELGALADRD